MEDSLINPLMRESQSILELGEELATALRCNPILHLPKEQFTIVMCEKRLLFFLIVNIT